MSLFYKEILEPVMTNIERFKERNAFCINGRYYTYGEFEKSVQKVYQQIGTHFCKNINVGLVINDDIETYASIFALWLTDCSYVPLHPGWPLDRCEDIIEQVGIDLILDSSASSRFCGKGMISTKCLPNEQVCDRPLAFCDKTKDVSNAYILFTSGSTGKPKGVQISKMNIAAFMNSFWKTGIEVSEEDRCLQCFDLTFDVSVQSYLVPLIKGACCYTVPNGKIKYIYASSLIEDYKLTFAAMAPSMLRYLKPYFEELDLTSLRTCILTAEACPLSLMEEWYKYAANTEIYDFYGPTECTIYCTYYKVTKGGFNKTLNGIIAIGKPLANCIGLILDEAGNELPAGEKGELCIAGDQVTTGYWNNMEKNASSFFDKEVNGVNMRFYHTGDLCYKDADGDIMYSGRLDHQVKIQGFRVEMGEIEYHAREFMNGVNAVAIAFYNSKGLAEIALFIESQEFDTKPLVEYLRTKMPLYMIPSRYYFESVFPLNGNGKIDKVVLKSKIKI